MKTKSFRTSAIKDLSVWGTTGCTAGNVPLYHTSIQLRAVHTTGADFNGAIPPSIPTIGNDLRTPTTLRMKILKELAAIKYCLDNFESSLILVPHSAYKDDAIFLKFVETYRPFKKEQLLEKRAIKYQELAVVVEEEESAAASSSNNTTGAHVTLRHNFLLLIQSNLKGCVVSETMKSR
jgi:hypothetical protein